MAPGLSPRPADRGRGGGEHATPCRSRAAGLCATSSGLGPDPRDNTKGDADAPGLLRLQEARPQRADLRERGREEDAHRGGTRKSATKPAAPREAAAVANTKGNLLGHVRQLREEVERGKAAEPELAEIRKLLA